MADPSTLSRQLFETTDADQAAEHLSRSYGARFRLPGGDGDFRYRHTRLLCDAFSIDTSTVTRETEFQVDNSPVLFIARPQDSKLRFDARGVTHRLGTNELILCNTEHDGAPFRARLLGGTLQGIILPFQALAEVAAASRQEREPIRFTHARPGTSTAAGHLTTTIDYLAGALRDRPEMMGQRLVAGAARRMLAASVLATFPTTALTEPTIEDRHDSHPRTLRRAMTFIDDTAQHDISAADIAAAANVTIRALQHAFRRHLGMTPMGYLRQVRLGCAHQELLLADPTSGVTVTEIAARWGFFHPGRFAGYYRGSYGCPPYRTMLREHS